MSSYDEDDTDFGLEKANEHRVQNGECIASIAMQTGHWWRTIWNHPQNERLKTLRKNPNILLPGDLLTIPPRRPLVMNIETEQRHRFRLKGSAVRLHLRILEDGVPHSNEPFVVFGEGLRLSGKTDGRGCLSITVPADAERIRIQIAGKVLDVRLGGTDPIDEVCGVQTRLANLGYPCPYNGKLDEATLGALYAFQHDAGLERSDNLHDGRFLDALRAWHDARQAVPPDRSHAGEPPAGPNDPGDSPHEQPGSIAPFFLS